MPATPVRDGASAVRGVRSSIPTVRDLEEFWPSRRSDAYDEFCR